jgi:hypothetical protein
MLHIGSQHDSLLKSGDVLAPTISELHVPYMLSALKTRIAQTRLATLKDENLGTNCRYFTQRYAKCVVCFLLSRANKLIAYEGHLTETVLKTYASFCMCFEVSNLFKYFDIIVITCIVIFIIKI